MSETWLAIPGKFRWNTREVPLFNDGLWHIHREGAPERLPVCTVDRGDDHDPPTRAKAESLARLIAAAPELYEALRQLSNVTAEIREAHIETRGTDQEPGWLADLIEVGRNGVAALAKARGESR